MLLLEGSASPGSALGRARGEQQQKSAGVAASYYLTKGEFLEIQLADGRRARAPEARGAGGGAARGEDEAAK